MVGFPQHERHVTPAPPQTSTHDRPWPGTPWDDPASALAAVLSALQRSNHATAFASWTVTTIGLGLVFQVRSVEAAGPTSTVLLTGLLLPVLAATTRVIVLLIMAGRAGAETAAGGAWREDDDPPTGATAGDPPTTGPSPSAAETLDRLRSLTDALRRREFLARTALNWAYVAGVAFLAWSLLTTLIPAGG
jgi:hypothetical protein